jgi:hypothetical protein
MKTLSFDPIVCCELYDLRGGSCKISCKDVGGVHIAH